MKVTNKKALKLLRHLRVSLVRSLNLKQHLFKLQIFNLKYMQMQLKRLNKSTLLIKSVVLFLKTRSNLKEYLMIINIINHILQLQIDFLLG